MSIEGNGGAISYINSNYIGFLIITDTTFRSNYALKSKGGAIIISNAEVKMNNNIMKFNKAAIGGAIYYQTIIPDSFKDLAKLKSENVIKDNFAYLFG